MAEDLEQVVVADEVEARELRPLLLEVRVQRLLALVELGQDRLEALAEAVHVAEADDEPVGADAESDGQYAVSQAVSATLRVIGSVRAADWSKQVKEEKIGRAHV